MRYAIIIEKGKRSYSAYSPDVPGCVAAAKTRDEVKKLMKEALAFHFKGMLLDNEPIPKTTCEGTNVDIDVAKITKDIRRQRRASSA